MGRRTAGKLLDLETRLLHHLAIEPSHAHAVTQDTGWPRASVHDALTRLEAAGYLASRWDLVGGGGPPRRVYRLAAKGRRALAKAKTK